MIKKYIAAGNQRSYGDMAISKHNIISMKKFNKILKFDERKGVIEVQSGVLLIDILKKIIDKGWFSSNTRNKICVHWWHDCE